MQTKLSREQKLGVPIMRGETAKLFHEIRISESINWFVARNYNTYPRIFDLIVRFYIFSQRSAY